MALPDFIGDEEPIDDLIPQHYYDNPSIVSEADTGLFIGADNMKTSRVTVRFSGGRYYRDKAGNTHYYVVVNGKRLPPIREKKDPSTVILSFLSKQNRNPTLAEKFKKKWGFYPRETKTVQFKPKKATGIPITRKAASRTVGVPFVYPEEAPSRPDKPTTKPSEGKGCTGTVIVVGVLTAAITALGIGMQVGWF